MRTRITSVSGTYVMSRLLSFWHLSICNLFLFYALLLFRPNILNDAKKKMKMKCTLTLSSIVADMMSSFSVCRIVYTFQSDASYSCAMRQSYDAFVRLLFFLTASKSSLASYQKAGDGPKWNSFINKLER